MGRVRKTRFDDYILKNSEKMKDRLEKSYSLNYRNWNEKYLIRVGIASNIRRNLLDLYDSGWDYVPHNKTSLGNNPLRDKLCELRRVLFSMGSEKMERTDHYILTLIWDINEWKMKQDIYEYFDNISLESLKWRFSINPDFRYRSKRSSK